MNEKEFLAKIKKARDRIKRERKHVKCRCSSFCLQYEGSCQCFPERKLNEAKADLWELLDRL